MTCTIVSINHDLKTVNLSNGMVNVSIHLLYQYAHPDYARTIDGFQGDSINIPFGILGIRYLLMTIYYLYSAIGRAVAIKLVHFEKTLLNMLNK